MATTKIWAVRGKLGQVVSYVENPDKTAASPADMQGLRDVMDYATKDGKTQRQCYVRGVNCTPAIAREEMQLAKKRFGKEGGIVAFHAYQSFAPGEVAPAAAHRIGLELAHELWGDRFQVVVATHLDKAHLHSHFVVNSVSFKDGGKFNDCLAFYDRMRRVSDRLCREHRLSVIENPQTGKRRSYDAWQADSGGGPSYHNLLRADIDALVPTSPTMKYFVAAMERRGYTFKYGKYVAIRPPGKERFTRLKTLGADYEYETIAARIRARGLDNLELPPRRPEPTRRHYRFCGVLHGKKKITGLRALYLHYCYLLRVIPKKRQANGRMHFLLREDLRKLDEILAQAKLLHTYHIDTREQLSTFQFNCLSALSALRDRRTDVVNHLRRCPEGEQREADNAERKALTEQITKLGREAKLAGQIEDRSAEIRTKMCAIKAHQRPVRQKTPIQRRTR